MKGDLVGRPLPGCSLYQCDHAIEKGLAWTGGDTYHDAIGKYFRAAGDGRTVTTTLANHRCRLASDRRFVNRRDAFDDLAVSGDDLAGLDDDHIAPHQ